MALEGHTVLVTRPTGQNTELRRCLENAGAEVLEIPTIELREANDLGALYAALDRIRSYDWLLFTSATAVEVFCRHAAGAWLPRVAVVGRQTARKAEALGVPVALVPEDFHAAGLAQALPGSMASKRVLLPRGDLAGGELPEVLRARGAEVDCPLVYRTRLPEANRQKLLDLFSGNRPDCVVFTSGSAVANFQAMLPPLRADEALAGSVVAVIGPVTRKAAETRGITVGIESPQASVRALAEAIRAHFERSL